MKREVTFLLQVIFLTIFLNRQVQGANTFTDKDSSITTVQDSARAINDKTGGNKIKVRSEIFTLENNRVARFAISKKIPTPDVVKDSVSVFNTTVVDKKTLLRLENLTMENNKTTNTNIAQISIQSSKAKSTNVRFSGFARSLFQYRVMSSYYAGTMPKSLTLNGVDVKDGTIIPMGTNNLGYPEPMLYLKMEANPSPQTSILIDYYFDNQLIGSNTTGKISTLYRMLQFAANTRTSVGTFKLIAGGGVNYYKLSPFTLWGNEYRDDMFERYPWEPEAEGGSAYSRYERYYNTQNISRDARWGNTGTQGFILEGSSLPGGFSVKLLYGKADNSGAFSGFQTQAPRNMVSGRVDKTFGRFGKNKFGINIFNQFGYVNSLAQGQLSQKIYTGDLRLNFKGVNIFSEMGLGAYQDPLYKFGWGKAVNVQAEFDKSVFKIPGMLQFYYINKSVINVNSSVMNSSHPNLQAAYGVGDSYTITTYQGILSEFGMLTNNRTGGYLKLFDSFLKNKKLKIILSTGASREIEHLDNQVTLYHRVNGFPRSRFTYFQNNVGPYNRIMSIYRRTFEHFTITDPNNYIKGFNILDLTIKYKFKIIGRDLIFINYVTYNSVQNGLSVIPKFTNKAYFRQAYEELMSFYKLMPKLSLVGFFGIERILGNQLTDAAPNGKNVNQTGIGYGAGFDYDFSPRAGFHMRHRWLSQQDKNFVLDKFKGQETSLEIKIFF
jgi:hypothetical protein